jgi:hypothetical protein
MLKDSVPDYAHPETNDDTTFVERGSTYESPDDQAGGDFCDSIYFAPLSALQDHSYTD